MKSQSPVLAPNVSNAKSMKCVDLTPPSGIRQCGETGQGFPFQELQ